MQTQTPSTSRAGPAAATSLPAVVIEGAQKRYGSVQALNGVDLTLRRGELTALLGPNGAGKSTLINLMLGLEAPSQGSVSVMGGDPRDPRTRASLGAMPQDLSLPYYPDGARAADALRRAVPESAGRGEGVLELCDLKAQARQRAGTLSGGQARRLGFGLSIIGDPELLFLDEPTVAMDVQSRHIFWEGVAQMQRQGKTIVLTTHYLEEAERSAARIVLLSGGRIVADGTPQQIKAGVQGANASLRQRSGAGRAARSAVCAAGQPRRRGPRHPAFARAGSAAGRAVRAGHRDSRAGGQPRLAGRSLPEPDRQFQSTRVQPPPGDDRMTTAARTPAAAATVPPFRAFAALFRTELLKLLRNRAFVLPSLLLPVMFFALFALPNLNGHLGGVQAGAVHGGVVCGVLAGEHRALRLRCEHRHRAGERLDAPTADHARDARRVSASKVLAAMLMGLLSVLVLVVFARVAGGVSLPLGTLGVVLLRLLVGMVPFALLGLSLGLALGPSGAAPPPT